MNIAPEIRDLCSKIDSLRSKYHKLEKESSKWLHDDEKWQKINKMRTAVFEKLRTTTEQLADVFEQNPPQTAEEKLEYAYLNLIYHGPNQPRTEELNMCCSTPSYYAGITQAFRELDHSALPKAPLKKAIAYEWKMIERMQKSEFSRETIYAREEARVIREQAAQREVLKLLGTKEPSLEEITPIALETSEKRKAFHGGDALEERKLIEIDVAVHDMFPAILKKHFEALSPEKQKALFIQMAENFAVISKEKDYSNWDAHFARYSVASDIFKAAPVFLSVEEGLKYTFDAALQQELTPGQEAEINWKAAEEIMERMPEILSKDNSTEVLNDAKANANKNDTLETRARLKTAEALRSHCCISFKNLEDHSIETTIKLLDSFEQESLAEAQAQQKLTRVFKQSFSKSTGKTPVTSTGPEY